MQKYTKKRKVHYWDTVLKCRVTNKSRTTITIDSTLECSVLECIINYEHLIEVGIHKSISLKSGYWVVDFLLQAKNIKGRKFLSKLLECYGVAMESSTVLLEAKGVQDKNFIDKLTRLCHESPFTAQSLILVGSEGSGFYYEIGDKYYLKPILPLTMFSAKLAQIESLL